MKTSWSDLAIILFATTMISQMTVSFNCWFFSPRSTGGKIKHAISIISLPFIFAFNGFTLIMWAIVTYAFLEKIGFEPIGLLFFASEFLLVICIIIINSKRSTAT